jgi:predicted short-subunit dehydrogenase-like oxidoreductase (DUF2520 family)
LTEPSTQFSCERLGLFGTGRVARAMLLGLAPASRSAPLLYGRTPDKARDAASGVDGADVAAQANELAQRCDLIVIAVSDDAVADAAHALAQHGPLAHRPLVFHVSGRSGAVVLALLARLGALTAAVHPVMTFTGDPETEVRRMAGARFAVTGSDAEASARAVAVVERLGGVPFAIEEAMRPLYHGALSHAANHLATLLEGSAGALKAAGVDAPYAVLAPLVRAAVENSLDQGFASLSGPLLRGDATTIRNHLDAFGRYDPAILPAYRAMALATLDMLERADRPASAACRELLESGRDT